MAGRGSKNHAHKYRKIKLGSERVFACSLPDCTHYIPKHMEELIIGKRAVCWNCDSEMAMDNEAYEMDMPICVKCRLAHSEIMSMLENENHG